MRSLTAALCLLAASTIASAAPGVGEPLPPLAIPDHGELLLQGDAVAYEPWDSNELAGKVNVVQYLAARLSVKDMYKPLNDQLEVAGFPANEFAVTAIVNLDDALFGTAGIANSEMKDNKRRYPESTIVADADGIGRETWNLEKKNGALLVVDRGGQVRFFKHGPLEEAEIEQVLALIRNTLGDTP